MYVNFDRLLTVIPKVAFVLIFPLFFMKKNFNDNIIIVCIDFRDSMTVMLHGLFE